LNLVDELQVLTRLEAYCFARGDADLGACARIAPHAGLPRFDRKHTETTKLDTIAIGECALHSFEDSVHSRLSLDAWESRPFNNTLNEILLDQ
jgi:hypothetical protein